eukprot:9066253-Pyramimonas_sp.AAC.1
MSLLRWSCSKTTRWPLFTTSKTESSGPPLPVTGALMPRKAPPVCAMSLRWSSSGIGSPVALRYCAPDGFSAIG